MAYHKVYPDNFIVLVGDEVDIGHELGIIFYREAIKSRVCILKGGIDAAKIECFHLLRKGSANQSV